MRTFVLAIRLLALAFIAVSLLHLFLGQQADAMLGSPITAAMSSDPSLDSQNRFYGVCFSLLGIVLLIAASDPRRYESMIAATFGVLFVAGIARAVAWALHGSPAPLLVGILFADLLLPPILYIWLRRSLRSEVKRSAT